MCDRERGGIVVERRTPNREVLGLIPTGVMCDEAFRLNSSSNPTGN